MRLRVPSCNMKPTSSFVLLQSHSTAEPFPQHHLNVSSVFVWTITLSAAAVDVGQMQKLDAVKLSPA